MEINQIKQKVDGIPHMTVSQAETITNLILENEFQNIIELGFRHGVSTCYMAGALDELGEGSITTIDLNSAIDTNPNIEFLLDSLGLSSYVNVFYEPTSYTWRLMKILEEDPEPRFDFCYLDGAHDWFTDGFAFFLVDKLLKPGGLIVFDDLDWTYETSPSLKNTDWVKNMPIDQRTVPQVRKVYELLVNTHPSYSDFMIKDDWAYARKIASNLGDEPKSSAREVIYQKEYISLSAEFTKLLRKIQIYFNK